MTALIEAPQPVNAFSGPQQSPYTPTPRKRRNVPALLLTGLLIGFSVVGGITSIGQANAITDLKKTVASQKATIAGLEDDAVALTEDLDAATADADLCHTEAVAWQDATLALADDFSNWLDSFPYGEIDLVASSDAAENARSIGCTG